MKQALLVLSFCLLASCATYQNKFEPKIDKSKYTWDKLEHTNYATAVNIKKNFKKKWWRNFQDPAINWLVFKAVSNNPDLKIAQSRVRQMRYDSLVSSSNLMPNFDLKQSSQYSKPSLTTLKDASLFNAELDSVWEMDLFGANQHASEASRYRYLSEIASRDGVFISLISEVIYNYIDFRKYQNLLKITKQSLASQKEILAMVKAKHESGIATQLDENDAKSFLLTTKARVYELEAALQNTQMRIETLCNAKTSSFSAIFKDIKNVPSIRESVILQSPIYTIQKRPDVMEAEQVLLQNTSLTKQSIASQYPKIDLNLALGIGRSNLTASRGTLELGDVAILPLFNFDRIKNQIKSQEEQEEQAFIRYQKTIMGAVTEVESSLVTMYNNIRYVNDLNEAAGVNDSSLQLSKDMYESSMLDYQSVLEVEKDFFASSTKLLEYRATTAKSVVALYKALGYGL